jgi:hypothetical protein
LADVGSDGPSGSKAEGLAWDALGQQPLLRLLRMQQMQIDASRVTRLRLLRMQQMQIAASRVTRLRLSSCWVSRRLIPESSFVHYAANQRARERHLSSGRMWQYSTVSA